MCYPNLYGGKVVLKIPIENQKERELTASLKMLSPGTSLRHGIDQIMQANTGGLIVVGDTPEILNLTEGGFRINCTYSPTRLSELAKMDGAIILSTDIKRIVRANVTLMLNASIPSNETGLRHRAAEKFAKETGHIVLAISKRRNTLTLYTRNQGYIFRERTDLMSGANHVILVLNQYVKTMQQNVATLNWAELNGSVTLQKVITAIQACERVRRTERELNGYQIELGNEAKSLQLIPSELSTEIERAMLIIKDYYRQEDREEYQVFEKIFNLTPSELALEDNICDILGYTPDFNDQQKTIIPQGYRMISQIPRISMNIVENIVKQFKTLDNIIASNIDVLKDVEGVGKTRASVIKETLIQMKSGTTQPQVLALPIFDTD